MSVNELLIAWGIPAAISTAIIGLVVWYFKRYLDRREVEDKKREESLEQFMLYILRDSRATSVLAAATAKAVQRIPDAKCNGDMKEALAKAEKIQTEEKDFIFNQGINNIFGK